MLLFTSTVGTNKTSVLRTIGRFVVTEKFVKLSDEFVTSLNP